MTPTFTVLFITFFIVCIVLTICTIASHNLSTKDFSDKCVFVLCLLLTIVCYTSTVIFAVSGNTTVEVSIVQNDSSTQHFILQRKNYDYDKHGITIYTDSVDIRLYDVKKIEICDVKN